MFLIFVNFVLSSDWYIDLLLPSIAFDAFCWKQVPGYGDNCWKLEVGTINYVYELICEYVNSTYLLVSYIDVRNK